MKRFIIAWFILLLYPVSAWAEIYEVKMLNRGTTGAMVFEPDYLEINPGDSVKFIATQKSHNAASIHEMMPQGAKPFKGQINEELEVTFELPGFYGIKCTPHYAMGMIMMIKVGDDVTLPDHYRAVFQPGLARKRFDNVFSRIDAGE